MSLSLFLSVSLSLSISHSLSPGGELHRHTDYRRGFPALTAAVAGADLPYDLDRARKDEERKEREERERKRGWKEWETRGI